MLNIIVKEHWEEWDKLVIAAEQCETSMSRINDNLKSLNMILTKADSQSVLEQKPDTSNESFGRGNRDI